MSSQASGQLVESESRCTRSPQVGQASEFLGSPRDHVLLKHSRAEAHSGVCFCETFANNLCKVPVLFEDILWTPERDVLNAECLGALSMTVLSRLPRYSQPGSKWSMLIICQDDILRTRDHPK